MKNKEQKHIMEDNMNELIYSKLFNYDDLKIAFCIQDFIDRNEIDIEENELTDFEDLAKLVLEIHNNWHIDRDFENLSRDELAYIQVYTYRYLKEKYLEA